MNCAATTPKTDTVSKLVENRVVVVDTACKWVQFIYVNREDDMTATTARQILAHNRAVKANCAPLKAPAK